MEPSIIYSEAPVFGNAQVEGVLRRGWFIGHFMQSADLRSTDLVEVKWGSHTAGEQRSQWSFNEEATTVSILIKGCFRLEFPDQTYTLRQEGDYVIWAPGTPHTWVAEADSTVLTVRYPSKSNDSMEKED